METNDLEKDLERLLSAYREKTKMPKIRSLNKDLGYLEARKAAEPYGGLPTNALHQKTLVETYDWKSPEMKAKPKDINATHIADEAANRRPHTCLVQAPNVIIGSECLCPARMLWEI